MPSPNPLSAQKSKLVKCSNKLISTNQNAMLVSRNCTFERSVINSFFLEAEKHLEKKVQNCHKNRRSVTAFLSFSIHCSLCSLMLNSRHEKAVMINRIVLYCTVEPRFNDLRYNDIPGITINNFLPTQQSYSKMYGAEPRYNDIPV